MTGPPVQAPYALSVDGPRAAIVANNDGVFVITEVNRQGYATARDITPPQLRGLSDHIGAVEAGGSALRISMEGDARFDFSLVSDDSGRTWTVTAPGIVRPVGTSLPPAGRAPRGLRLDRAIRFPHGLAWAQAFDTQPDGTSSIVLLVSSDDGRDWQVARTHNARPAVRRRGTMTAWAPPRG